MKISLRAYSGFFLLLTIGFVTFSFKKTADTQYVPKPQSIIDQSLKGIFAQRFDEMGNLSQVLSMDSWQHKQGDMVSALTSPHLILYQPNGEHWIIRAKHGLSKQTQVHGKIETLDLSQDVMITRFTDPADRITLNTPYLVLEVPQSIAFTKENVVIIGDGMSIEAQGMRANLKDHTINLLSNVKSHYVVPKA